MGVFKMVLISALVASVLLGCEKKPVTYEGAMALYSEIEQSAFIEETDDKNAGKESEQRLLRINDLVKRTSTYFDGEDDYIACTDAAKSAQKVWDEFHKFWLDWQLRQEYQPEKVIGIKPLFDSSFSTGGLQISATTQ